MTDEGDTTLLIKGKMKEQLEAGARSKGYSEWTEYARALLVRGLEEDRKGPLNRTG